jgi:hypothetical protein
MGMRRKAAAIARVQALDPIRNVIAIALTEISGLSSLPRNAERTA